MTAFRDALTPDSWGEFGNIAIPPAELTETEDAIELKLEVPGINVADLDIQVTVNLVAISGDRKCEINEKIRYRHLKHPNQTQMTCPSEFRYGKFSRVISLPKRIQNTALVNA